ncbi:hypothetical protein A2W14_03760 [Candidatus Gottesmanbacteria bacterium RBG_16_37_8]|uniref:FecR protein domain-containing protein n=1 Tax=Candidatus Gottesmanbacteria bacterium RBG_16_37_8 TaxID=1798371 RepID=A0A1F5YNH2_9BACT|nr:MAG: hypothetical protein A2W14_03760 [Candidatus Gottesmanbacteria bacterium RBG_16_37_8]
MFRKLFLSLLFLLITTSPVQAVSWPPEVKPEQGKASGTFEFWDAKQIITIDFWNVGQTGGEEYSKATVSRKCAEKQTSDGWTCVDDEPMPEGIFSGGPNGTITLEGEGAQLDLHLVDGKYFEFTVDKTYQAPVENPEIFSKYRWSMDESIPIPEIKEGKYEVETYGAVRFNDLFGQVEVNIPNPDGTYDEESWNLAKIDMELPPGTRLKVSEKSGLILALPNQAIINVGPETEIVLVSVDPREGAIQLLYGNLKANIKKMMKDGSMEVEMSQAVAGIKGTSFILSDTKTESSIRVTEGIVKFTSKSTGVSVDVGKGESVTASSKGLSEKITFDPIEEENKWQVLSDNFKKINTDVAGNNNKNLYLVVGIVFAAAIIGFLILKIRKSKLA